MSACERAGCTGTIEDGFCTVCGMAPAATPGRHAAPATGTPTPTANQPTANQPTASPPAARTAPARPESARTVARGSTRTSSSRTGSTRTGSTRTGSTRSSRSSTGPSRRGRLGAGLVEVPPVPYRDPAEAVLANPEVAERKRFCSNCGEPVGRGRDGRPGRTEGFCRNCGTAYSFTPKLVPGDLVGGQYEVLGCIAHGGLGWIYLARDRNVNDRWVVLKGLLDTGDSEAMAAAVAERRFLAEVEHPNIVRIYNFVQHPDPKSGTMVGYIVMEYVGGSSLKELRSVREQSGQLRPLPIGQAIAYGLEVLPALGYLHGLGLLYNDFKPDNVIQSQEQLKLIDLGAVRRLDDEESPTYKTDGYCAPELGTEGPSIGSDLYTVARTLAVLTFNFDYVNAFRDKLPDPADVPLFAKHGSFYRFLMRATDPDPDLRFASAAEMTEQLTGVLREVMATEDGKARPALSTVFSPERRVFGAEPENWPAVPSATEIVAALPVPQVDGSDPAASLLATASATNPAEVIAALTASPLNTVEVRLRIARARIELGDLDGAGQDLDALAEAEPGDWRITWYSALIALAADDCEGASAEFDAVYQCLPGEPAAKLALAIAEEFRGNTALAGRFYELVWRTDPAYLSAAFGLARVRLAADDRAGAVAVLESVPNHSSYYVPAQLAAIRARMHVRTPAALSEADLVAAGARLDAVELDQARRNRLSIEVLEAARGWLDSGGGTAVRVVKQPVLLGCGLNDKDLRLGLERCYRALARLAERTDQRIELVDRANSVRPVTWV